MSSSLFFSLFPPSPSPSPPLSPSSSLSLLFQERNTAASLDKKQKQIDKQMLEWKSRYEAKEAELDAAQRDSRTANTEV